MRGISQPDCVSLHERISVSVNVPNESSYYCWEPAGRLHWQPVISAPHTLKIPSRWHPFVPLPSPPFSSHQLCSTYSKMSLLLTRQSYVLLLQLKVAVRKISVRRRGVVLFWLFWTLACGTLWCNMNRARLWVQSLNDFSVLYRLCFQRGLTLPQGLIWQSRWCEEMLLPPRNTHLAVEEFCNFTFNLLLIKLLMTGQRLFVAMRTTLLQCSWWMSDSDSFLYN